MKSRFNMAGDDQVTPADDELTPADDQLTPADDQVTPVTPADDQVTSADDEMLTGDDPLTPAADHDQAVPGDDQATSAADSYHRGPGDQEVPAAEEEHMLPGDDQVVLAVEDDQAPAENDQVLAEDDQVVLVVEDDQALADDGQGAPAYAGDRVADAAASTPAAASTGESSDSRWHEIQAMFVDDPRASVEQAAAVVNDSVETFVSSVKDRQSSLHSAWQGNDADTEQLRTALQHYRDFSRNLDDFSRQS